MKTTRPKAIALLSGGLDSLLSAKLVKDEGVEVLGLHLLSPFGCREEVARRASAIGVPVQFREKGTQYLDLIKSPKYGRGRAMNPCIDCRIFMFEFAERVLQEEGADFIVTGEVLGQRPMSQQRKAMDLIDRKSPLEDRILRPLSAHAFPPTLAERMGWVKRENLLNIRGRGRDEQLRLKAAYGLTDYSSPGGGCLLTETAFNGRLKDFFAHDHFNDEKERLAQSELLRVGRHFRIDPGIKIVVSKNAAESETLRDRYQSVKGTLLEPDGFSGPSAIVLGDFNSRAKRIAGGLIARYGKPIPEAIIRFVNSKSEEGEIPLPAAITPEELEEYRL